MVDRIKNISFNFKGRYEVINFKNISRSVDRFSFADKSWDNSHLSSKDKKYVYKEIESIKTNHPFIESKQQMTVKNNINGNCFKHNIFNYNSITHDGNKGVPFGTDKTGKGHYLNTSNLKVSGIEDGLIQNNSYKVKHIESTIKNHEDILIENVDIKMWKWIDCMQLTNGNSNKCYDVMFWKENSLGVINAFVNNGIDFLMLIGKY